MVCTPTPAIAGSKLLPTIPFPEKVPPVGFSFNPKAGIFSQVIAGTMILSIGNGNTITVSIAVFEQPSLSIIS